MAKNRLADERSIYLRSHADDPVEWYSWGPDAFNRAKEEGKPIFLSIGYSACHWCHVMQKECFKNPEIAEVLNRYFIPVKVDREEHTDIDEIYMHAVVQMTGSGGWPLSVFLTKDLRPFFGGTYFPPYPIGQHPGFLDILRYIQQLWTEKREQIEKTSINFTALIQSHLTLPPIPSEGQDYKPLLDKAVYSLSHNFDKENGGWGLEPKFPPNLVLPFLLCYTGIYHDAHTGEMVKRTLLNLALSGLHDHVGGGFYRYCTDRIWHVPHFEKMLYDNVQLANAYLQCYTQTQIPFFKFIAENTLNYLLRELYNEKEGFLASQDADSEHEEGKFYVWRYDDIKNILGEDSDEFCKFFGIETEGNWKELLPTGKGVFTGKNIPDPKYAGMVYGDINQCIKKYYEFIPHLKQLFSFRENREKPVKDNKCITSWNALAISTFTKASVLSPNGEKYQKIAIGTADNFLNDYKTLGFLPHVLRNSKIEGFIEDYALFIVALLDLYETTLNEYWIEKAVMLAEKMIHFFWDEEGTGFYRTSHRIRKQYPVSSKPILDHQEPSGNAISAFAMAKLGFLANSEYLDLAEQLCQGYYGWIQRAPEAFPAWLNTMLLLKHRPIECTIFSGGTAIFPFPVLLQIYNSKYPYFVLKRNRDLSNEPGGSIALFCYNQTCSAPVYNLQDITPAIVNLVGKNNKTQ